MNLPVADRAVAARAGLHPSLQVTVPISEEQHLQVPISVEQHPHEPACCGPRRRRECGALRSS